MSWYSYIHRTDGGSLWVGESQDLRQSIIDHMIGRIPGAAGSGAIVWSHTLPTRTEAERLSRRVRSLSRPKKKALIGGDAELLAYLLRGRKRKASP